MSFDKIHEVVDYFPMTTYPLQVHGHMGVINLRGNVVPIIDPFNITLADHNLDQCKYVIIETNQSNLVGMIVAKAKKVDIPKELVSEITEEQVVPINGHLLRFLRVDAVLKIIRKK